MKEKGAGERDKNTCVICYSPLWEERDTPPLVPSALGSPTANQDSPHEDVYSLKPAALSLYLRETKIH